MNYRVGSLKGKSASSELLIEVHRIGNSSRLITDPDTCYQTAITELNSTFHSGFTTCP